jgi:membrane associated rhomboid family serine protease
MLRLRKKTTTDHAGHLGGLLSGLAAAYYIKSRQQQQQPKARSDVMKHTPALQTVDV